MFDFVNGVEMMQKLCNVEGKLEVLRKLIPLSMIVTLLVALVFVLSASTTTADGTPHPMVAAGSGHSVALTSNGKVYTWGNNGNGQLGDGTTTNRNTPVQVSNLILLPSTYTITFNPNGGSVSPTSATTSTDGKLTNLPTPTQPRYTFTGWYTTATSGTQITTNYIFTTNTPIYAHWQIIPVTYTVTYDGNDNTGGSVPVDDNSPYPAGSTVAVFSQGSLVKIGYTFQGWATSATSTAATTSFIINTNTILYAIWQQNTISTTAPIITTPPTTSTTTITTTAPSSSITTSPSSSVTVDSGNTGTSNSTTSVTGTTDGSRDSNAGGGWWWLIVLLVIIVGVVVAVFVFKYTRKRLRRKLMGKVVWVS
jgi:uncharacterized repeat protein (TIGR02543 family)